uniref:Intraflagellar Transport Protein 20 putative n=1 Tax=Albugo laibachii Nc14 TaxID=890382 RepID=F0WTS2_9STRA|nr:Intraflagellar Transport Protein 20 putative [Albugo laibachii Nc14]|eukprot:CCA24765.1 Intraflagellar Transport Protein 20 putative [Albugo laibachii Nc14]
MRPSDNQLPHISFDDEYRLHALEKDQISHTQELEVESNQFVTKVDEFHEIIKGVLQVLEAQEQRIEREKLKAIGERNKVESELENRNRQKGIMLVLIKEKETELERYNLQYESLFKVLEEQQALMEKLSNNET